MFEQASHAERRGAAFARHRPKAASLEKPFNYLRVNEYIIIPNRIFYIYSSV